MTGAVALFPGSRDSLLSFRLPFPLFTKLVMTNGAEGRGGEEEVVLRGARKDGDWGGGKGKRKKCRDKEVELGRRAERG